MSNDNFFDFEIIIYVLKHMITESSDLFDLKKEVDSYFNDLGIW